MWGALAYSSTLFPPPSRRLANYNFFTWTLAYNLTLLAGALREGYKSLFAESVPPVYRFFLSNFFLRIGGVPHRLRTEVGKFSAKITIFHLKSTVFGPFFNRFWVYGLGGYIPPPVYGRIP